MSLIWERDFLKFDDCKSCVNKNTRSDKGDCKDCGNGEYFQEIPFPKELDVEQKNPWKMLKEMGCE